MITRSIKVSKDEVMPFEYNRENGIVGFMDCGGSNLVKLNEQIPNVVKLIATGRIYDGSVNDIKSLKLHPDCKAREKAKLLKVPLVELDFRHEEKLLDIGKGDYLKAITQGLNANFANDKSYCDVVNSRRIICGTFLHQIYSCMNANNIQIDIPGFGAGFMQLFSREFIDFFGLILNVHPGDLTKLGPNGKRMLSGDAWVPSSKALLAGHDKLYSSIHMMNGELDAGPLVMRGYALPIDYNKLSRINLANRAKLKEVSGFAQEALKYIGDHVIAGATFSDLFDGNYGIHKSGVLSYRFNGEWYLAPNGIMIEDHVANNPKTPFQREPGFIDDKVQEFYKNVDAMKNI